MERPLPRVAMAGALGGLVLALFAMAGHGWAVTAGWAVSALCALTAAMACRLAGRRTGVAEVARRTWRRIGRAMVLVAVVALARLVEWVAGGQGSAGRIGASDAVAHALLILLFVAPFYRLPSAMHTRLSTVLEAGALALCAGAYVGFFVVRQVSHRESMAAGAVTVSAMIAVLLSARIVLTGFNSPYRRLLLQLSAAVVVGGLAPGLLLALSTRDLRPGTLLIPLACLALVRSGRPGAGQAPLPADAVERWQRRVRLLPFLAVGLTDALLMVALVVGSLAERVVVGTAAVLLTAVAVARQVISERETRLNESRFRQLAQNSYDVITISRLDNTITFMSGGSRRMFGRTPGQRTGGNLVELLHPDDQAAAEADLAEVARTPGHTVRWRSRLRHADGSWRRIEVLSTNLLDEPSVRGIVSNTRDITETHDLTERLGHQATHDALTGLGNRALCHQRLGALLADGHRLSVVLADLDDFKIVNDTLGHGVGDQLLVAIAGRLRGAVRSSDTVARLGGDEFAILLVDQDQRAVERVLADVLASLREPVRIEGREHDVRASLGVVAGEPGDDADELMRRADIAMYEAKARGDGGWQQYRPGMRYAAGAAGATVSTVP